MPVRQDTDSFGIHCAGDLELALPPASETVFFYLTVFLERTWEHFVLQFHHIVAICILTVTAAEFRGNGAFFEDVEARMGAVVDIGIYACVYA